YLGFNSREQRRVRAGGAFEVLLRHDVVLGATLAFRTALRDLVLPIPPPWAHDRWIPLLLAAATHLAPLPPPPPHYPPHPPPARPATAGRRPGRGAPPPPLAAAGPPGGGARPVPAPGPSRISPRPPAGAGPRGGCFPRARGGSRASRQRLPTSARVPPCRGSR